MSTIRITEFGAVGDGINNNTSAIQTAIDYCDFGGTVIIPKGRFVSGALFLKSNMKFVLEPGACLIGSELLDDYPVMKYRFEGEEQDCYASLINVKEGSHSDIIISGGGTIDASGVILCGLEKKNDEYKRGRAVCIRNVSNVLITDIELRNSPSWCLHLVYCSNVYIDKIKISTKYNENGKEYKGIINGDGLVVDSCKNVQIINSTISSQDDCIAIKSGKGKEGREKGLPSSDVLIENCIFVYGGGVAIGSEMSGNISNIFIRNCSFKNVLSLLSIKTVRGRGGTIKNIHIEHCSLCNDEMDVFHGRVHHGVIYMDAFYKQFFADKEVIHQIDDGTPSLEEIYFDNIEIYTVSGSAIYLYGLPEKYFSNIYFNNFNAICERDITLKNVTTIGFRNAVIKRLGTNIDYS